MSALYSTMADGWRDDQRGEAYEGEISRDAATLIYEGVTRQNGTQRNDTTPKIPENGAVVSTVSATTNPFPLQTLPYPLRDYVEAAADAIGCDAAYVALPMLTVIAGAIGNTRRIEVKPGWTEPAIIWTAIVGESGTQKSPAIDLGRDLSRRRQAKAIKQHKTAMKEYEPQKARWESAIESWKKSSAIGEPPPKPEHPVLTRSFADDTTIEALGQILAENWRGTTVIKDELAGWLGGFDRYAGKGKSAGEAAKWLEMHAGRPVIIDRRHGDPRTLYIPCAAVSITGGIQPAILRKLISQEYRDNGLLARLLMAWPERRPRRWTEAEPPEALTNVIRAVYDHLWELQATTDPDGEPAPLPIPMSAAAKGAFVQFVNENGQEQFTLEGDLAAAWSKLEGYASRLALIHHLIRWACDPAGLMDGAAVDLESMQAGITLVRWFAQEDRRIYATLSETAIDSQRRELVDLVRRNEGRMTARQLQRKSRRFAKSDDAEAALNDLVSAEKGIWKDCPPSPRGGQPTCEFVLH